MIKPKTEAELSEVISGTSGPLAIQGGGTRGVRLDGEALSVAALSGVTLYEPGALTIVAQAGTPVSQINDVLAAERQRLPFEPMDHRELLGTTGTPTIGGVLAGNVSGPRRIQVGAARDLALGVRFVDGTGAVVKNGGRVMKNVTGYDLVKLMAGSWGTLGVLTEVSFKVLPLPEASMTLSVDGLDAEKSVAGMSAALASPFDVTGAARDVMGKTLIRLEGFADSVAYRAEALARDLSDYGAVEQVENSDQVWADIRDVTCFADQPGDVWRVSVKPSDAPGVLAAINPDAVQMDWGGGLLWLLVPEGTAVRDHMQGMAGHATLVRGQGQPMLHPEPAAVRAISAGLRAKFDPRGILNQGVMG